MESKTSAAIKRWYPVYTNPRAEKKTVEVLTDKGILTYLPLHRQLKQWSDRKKWVEEPFIKSYVFVNIAEHERTSVLMTKGVSRFLYFSGKPASMPDRQISELKLLMASSLELEITEEDLQAGEKIIIKAGPLKGLTGEVVSRRSQKQLIVRLESIGCSIIVHVAASFIERF
ncbi:UpxY family transcription antiterminator [Mucilaginibacter sabulilitoris]|uniref:UpxY family transcription antiterminator n=1 Tax=Mucilaginibacter sabulilitoris TaxID=1173583 RepID=A0ABZ0TKB7_9SPHI|nr:UpxY family transcription antiterminator [Mucilaginibacter sabulilitoris]WPU91630.1 UpxY family transcription antiterminator [Mucilaginibacter sabulilitoris]